MSNMLISVMKMKSDDGVVEEKEESKMDILS
jgi:hypothetical protein